MTKELRAIAESIVKRYGTVDADCPKLARVWLAANRADADEPITAKWLKTTNGKKFQSGSYGFFGPERDAKFCQVWIEANCGGFVSVIFLRGINESLWYGLEKQTRGQLRALCRALGVFLADQPHGEVDPAARED